MTISRAAVATYLNEQFSSLAAAVGQNATPATGYVPDIDNALRKLGKTETELATATVEDGTRDAYFTLAEYYAARRFWRQLSDRATIKVDDSSFDYKHLLTNAQMLMDDAAKLSATLGYSVATSGWTMGHLNMDWIEAEEAETA